MRQESTEIFRHYREIARTVWNLGFCVRRELPEWDSALAYREAMARLFEATILIPLGFDERIERFHCPGEAVHFAVVGNSAEVGIMLDPNLPDHPFHVWGRPVPLGTQPYALRFYSFFDWYKLGYRDFGLLRVEIERMDERPEFVGHQGLIAFSDCSIRVDDDACSGGL